MSNADADANVVVGESTGSALPSRFAADASVVHLAQYQPSVGQTVTSKDANSQNRRSPRALLTSRRSGYAIHHATWTRASSQLIEGTHAGVDHNAAF
ncbi:hypothetical protein ACH4UM_09845 [Streptomyces sp. NPDC020801]|uniref:hypothetical protein n=1 Tax=Streptomyces sp. NPDC020801 TaxID=3365093 RepID=UPI0037B740AD